MLRLSLYSPSGTPISVRARYAHKLLNILAYAISQPRNCDVSCFCRKFSNDGPALADKRAATRNLAPADLQPTWLAWQTAWKLRTLSPASLPAALAIHVRKPSTETDRLKLLEMDDPGRALLDLCNAARQEGADFSAIWNGMLKDNHIVAGVPASRSTPFGPLVEVPLTTGGHLEFGPHGFSLRQITSR
jgi:hypothetical protein